MPSTILHANAIQIPTGNTAARPTGVDGMLRVNTETFRCEVYFDNSWVPFASKIDGSTAAKALLSTTDLTAAYNDFGYSGQNELYIKNDSGTAVETSTYKDGNSNVWYLIGGIGDRSSGGGYTGWWNSNRWRGSNTLGSLSYANREYKNSLYYDSTYTDLMVMQGYSEGSLSSDWYGNSSDVAYTSSGWLSTRGYKLSSFLGGNNGPNLGGHGQGGRTQISLSFLKGSASSGRGRMWTSDTQNELSTNNVFDWGPQNAETYRYAVINVLGCQQNGQNTEHYAWAPDVAENYASRNCPGYNYGSPWGLNYTHPHHYWLMWAK